MELYWLPTWPSAGIIRFTAQSSATWTDGVTGSGTELLSSIWTCPKGGMDTCLASWFHSYLLDNQGTLRLRDNRFSSRFCKAQRACSSNLISLASSCILWREDRSSSFPVSIPHNIVQQKKTTYRNIVKYPAKIHTHTYLPTDLPTYLKGN